MKKKFQNKKLKKTALSQIFLLVISIVAVGYILGSEVGVVSGAEVKFNYKGKSYSGVNLGEIHGEHSTTFLRDGYSWFFDKNDNKIMDGDEQFMDKKFGESYTAQLILLDRAKNSQTPPAPTTAPAPAPGTGSALQPPKATTPSIESLKAATPIGTKFTAENSENSDGVKTTYTLVDVEGEKKWSYGKDKYTDNADVTWERFQKTLPPAAILGLIPPVEKITKNDVIEYKVGDRIFKTQTEAEEYTKELAKSKTETDAAAVAAALLAAEAAKKPQTAEDIAKKCETDEKFAKSPVCSSYLGILGESLLYAGIVYGGIKLFGPILGFDNQQTEAVSRAFAIGTLAGKLTQDYGLKYGWFENAEVAGTWGTWTGIGAAAAYFLANYKQQDSKTVKFSCIPWQAPIGGNNCEQCNKQFLPCSEYQCKSLGQNCELENKGTSDEKCVWVNRNDVTAPIIEPLEQSLLNDKYSYDPDSAILPPDRGVKILFADTEDKCIPAFTPLRFGISANEPAKCKLDILRKDKFEEMDVVMSDGLLGYNHTFSLSLPGSANLNSSGIELENGGDYELFVRCEDANGNSNIGTFVFRYCVQEGPDTTPPLIVATSLPDNAPIAFNQSSVGLQVYVNEPSECSWSHNNRDYDSMENKMECLTEINDADSQGLYSCDTNLTGMKDRFTNAFYIRCKDQPQKPENDRNANAESFILNILGTQPLVIDEISPENETIKDSTSPVKVTIEVKTSAGYDLGKSLCYYSDTGNEDDNVKFFETDSFQHKQELFLPAENYTYYIRCVDLGGNSDEEIINFSIESDNQSPIVVRATHEEQYLKIITNEDAKCVYDIVDCSYPIDSGKPLTEINGKNHFTDWNIQSNIYIKCQDSYGNQPLPNQCSIIVKSSDF